LLIRFTNVNNVTHDHALGRAKNCTIDISVFRSAHFTMPEFSQHSLARRNLSCFFGAIFGTRADYYALGKHFFPGAAHGSAGSGAAPQSVVVRNLTPEKRVFAQQPPPTVVAVPQ
jgi:hypothetical protein